VILLKHCSALISRYELINRGQKWLTMERLLCAAPAGKLNPPGSVPNRSVRSGMATAGPVYAKGGFLKSHLTGLWICGHWSDRTVADHGWERQTGILILQGDLPRKGILEVVQLSCELDSYIPAGIPFVGGHFAAVLIKVTKAYDVDNRRSTFACDFRYPLDRNRSRSIRSARATT